MSETTPERQPDSHDALQRSFATAVEKMQERRRYYAAVGVAALLIALGVMFWVNTTGPDTSSNFSLVWTDYDTARGLLDMDKSAARELARLEKRLASVRGTDTEPHALWLLAIGHYREAFTKEKVRDAQRNPHLEKAAALQPGDPQAALLYGLVLQAVGREDEARPFLERGSAAQR